MRTYPESTQVWAEVRFLDRFDRPFVPGTARYRMEDDATDTLLQDWSALPSGPVVEVAVTPELNRILNDRNKYEIKVLTIQSDYGTNLQLSQEVRYRIKNLAGFES